MALTPDNIDPTEATEAKLCAYLENELGADERAEIERYLQANPQHQQLLGELARTRQYVRALPRESAPAEIAEAFHGQLERSMLLGDNAAGDAVAGRINRWPQMMLVAAMVVLALGLFAVVCFVLPGQGSGPTQYSVAPSTAPTAGRRDTGAVAVRDDDRVGGAAPLVITEPEAKKEAGAARMRLSKAGTPVDATEAPGTAAPGAQTGNIAVNTPAASSASDEAKLPAGPLADSNFSGPRAGGRGGGGEEPVRVRIDNNTTFSSPDALPPLADALALNERMARSNETVRKLGAAPGNTLYVVVCTDDPGAAASQVRQYFDFNGIAYAPLPAEGALVGSAQKDGVSAGNPSVAPVPGAAGAEVPSYSKSGGNTGEVSSKVAQQELQQNKQYLPQSELPAGKQGASEVADQSSSKDLADKTGVTADTQRRGPMVAQPNEEKTKAGETSNQALTPTQNAGVNDYRLGANRGLQNGNVATGDYNNNYLSSNQSAAANGQANDLSFQRLQQSQQAHPEILGPQDVKLSQAGAAQGQSVQVVEGSLTLNAVTAIDNNDAYFAKGITRRDALALSSTLSSPRLGQTAALFSASDRTVTGGFGDARGGGGGGGGGGRGGGVRGGWGEGLTANGGTTMSLGAAATQPATSPSLGTMASDTDADSIRTRERLKVSVDQLMNPALGLDKNNEVRVAEDGTILLPMLDPLPAAGRTTRELEAEIAARYRQANLIPDATVRVNKELETVSSQPSELVTVQKRQEQRETTASPSTQPMAAERLSDAPALQNPTAAAVSAPMPPVTQPFDGEKVDVVVLVQRNLIATRPEPATQPAGEQLQAPVQAK